MSETEKDNKGFSLDGRVMCSDDACIGVVGTDNKCKVCGLAYDGDEVPNEAPDTTDVLDEAQSENASESTESTAEEQTEEADPNERVCCPDDACIGIIGSNGKCGTCGKDKAG